MKTAQKFGSQPNYSIYTVNGKMGLACGLNFITQPKYDLIYPFVGCYSIVKCDNKFGVVNQNGMEIIPVKYKTILQYSETLIYYLSEDDIWRYNDYNAKIINVKAKHEIYTDDIASLLNKNRNSIMVHLSEDDFKLGFVSFNVHNDFYGTYIVNTRKIIKNASYIDDIKMFFIEKDGKYGIADIYGNHIVSYKYDELNYAGNGLIRAELNSRYGFIDTKGNIVISFDYEIASDFLEGFALVMKNNKWGVIDKSGSIVVPITHNNNIIITDSGIIILEEEDIFGCKYTIHNKNINVVLKRNYNRFMYDFNGDWNLVRTQLIRKHGLIKLNGELILEPIYDGIYATGAYNQLIIEIRDKAGLVDYNGKEILPIKYDGIKCDEICYGNYSLVYYRVWLNGKVGVINNNMDIIVPIQYDDITYDSTYKAYVVRLGKIKAMIDLENNILIPFNDFL